MSEITKIDQEKRIVFGWAYQTHDPFGEVVIDKSGEFVDDIEELEKAAYHFVLESRTGGADHKRDGDRVVAKSTLVESVVFTPEKRAEMGIPEGLVPNGWWTGWKIHDDETWQRVKKGELTSFSVHGKGTKKAVGG